MAKANKRRGLIIDGHCVCQTSYRLLLGIGKHRMQRLRMASVSKDGECPGDGRYISKKGQSNTKLDEQRVAVTEFLTRCYHNIAESLPEAAEDKRPDDAKLVLGNKKCLKKRGKRPRHFRKHEPGGAGYTRDIKFLPPGSIGLYWELCKTEHAPLQIGRKLFTRASCSSSHTLSETKPLGDQIGYL